MPRNGEAYLNDIKAEQCAPENLELMTYETPDTGKRVNRAWSMPRSYEELVERRKAIEAWCELHHGYLGRSPDHVASSMAGLAMGLGLFRDYDPARAGALEDYYRYARDRDLFIAYTIINKSKQAHEQQDQFLALRLLDQDSDGIVVKGAKMLGTSCVMADEVWVSCIQPLAPGDEPYALSFCTPMSAEGLRILSRKSYEQSAHSRFDNPLFPLRQSALVPLRRKRRRALFRRGQGALGAGFRPGRPGHVPEAVLRDALLRLRGVSGGGSLHGEAAVPRGDRAAHHRGQRNHQDSRRR
jgi:aromatic ring hydroxylase